MKLECPSCDSRNVTTVWTEHTFQYGVFSPVSLVAKVPLRRCRDCQEAWLDYIGEQIMSEVVFDFQNATRNQNPGFNHSYQDGL